MTNISNMFLFNTGAWKLVSGSFMILFNRKYSKVWPFLIVHIYHFLFSLTHLFEKKEYWNLDISGYWVIGAGR